MCHIVLRLGGWGSPQGVVANLLDCCHKVSEFELQSLDVQFRTTTNGKD